MNWHEDYVALLKKCWAKGVRTEEIAVALNELAAARGDSQSVFNKNKVIGKAHGLKLPKHPKKPGGQTKVQLEAQGSRQYKSRATPAARRWNNAPVARRIALIQRTRPAPKPKKINPLPFVEQVPTPVFQVIENPAKPYIRDVRDRIIEEGVRNLPVPQRGPFIEDERKDLNYGATLNAIIYKLIDVGVA